jgi:hypothetical protein
MKTARICSQCGKENTADKRFCVECGARLPDERTTQGGDEGAVSPQELIDLMQQIVDRSAPDLGDAAQEERIARLVHMGPAAVPAAIGAVWSAIRYGDRDPSRLQNVGLLCEAIGRMGGDKAYAALARLATQESTVSGYAHVRAGAVRGLGHLGDRRAEPLLAAALDQDRGPGAAAEIPDRPQVEGVESAGPGHEAAASEHVESAPRSSPASETIDAWVWIAIAGALLYVGLVILVFFVPEIPFCVGSAMLIPTVIGLILARGSGPSFFERHPSGCMWILASLAGGLILYGLLWLFQRSFFLHALETF